MKALAAFCGLLVAACDPSYALRGDPPPLGNCHDGSGVSRFVVENFYRRALIEKQVRPAFEAYTAPDFVEHKPDVALPTREGAITMLEGLVTRLPEAKWEIVRIAADDGLVAVHARFSPAPGAEPYAIADFFRVQNCRIVEHWDVVAGPVAGAQNPLPRF